jgi:uncharacterized protein (UPF0332 family)
MFDPKDFLSLTEGVLAGIYPQTEEFRRSAVSRAYYSAHLASREYLLSKSKVRVQSDGKVRHNDVIDAFASSRDPSLKHKLHQLKSMRESADYRLADAVGIPEVRNARDLAVEVHRTLPTSFV